MVTTEQMKRIVINQLTGDNLKQIVEESCQLQIKMLQEAIPKGQGK